MALPDDPDADHDAFALLVDVVREIAAAGDPPQLSGLKNQLRRRVPDFSEKRYGFGSFLSFAKAARARDLIEMEWSDDTGDYVLRPTS
ncbi:OST-HTH/LOTUS domain-containing protein [Pseudonocardia sp. HH130629-09]|uniref:OST-HTH/LOTUS domain-containing protein n=1 Tax=Pseudonocardia sp. HH130629-09 TaxID=1641402 RepID=UPI000AB54F45|nr:OST-HTH/LOTUS domain-containing protein [Pseudonocardia sp. HH130629-09]